MRVTEPEERTADLAADLARELAEKTAGLSRDLSTELLGTLERRVDAWLTEKKFPWKKGSREYVYVLDVVGQTTLQIMAATVIGSVAHRTGRRLKDVEAHMLAGVRTLVRQLRGQSGLK